MKFCPYCRMPNEDSNRFCPDCGTALISPHAETVVSPAEAHRPAVTTTHQERLKKWRARLQADILFVLDCTGSMQGELDAIRDAMTGFVDTIEADGVQARVGLIAFRDRLIDEEPELLQFAGSVFTSDPEIFRREVNTLTATGGGDDPESSLDALMLALRQPFTPGRTKVIVLITDAPPHCPDRETQSIEEVVQKIAEVGISQCYLVIRPEDEAAQVYLKLLQGSGAAGLVYDLGHGDDFRARAERFKETLKRLGKDISTGVLQSTA